MADLKISQLPAATTPLAGTEVLPIVQSSTTDKVAVSDLTAGRAVSAASLTLTTTPLASGSGGTGLTTFTAANNALYSTAAGTLTASTLPVAAGGTNKTSWTANGIVYASGTTTLANGSALTFDGTNLLTTGSATAASFVPSRSTVPTNGMYLPSANAVAIATNSTLAMAVSSTQTVGIGTTRTDKKLNIAGAIALGDGSAAPRALIGPPTWDASYAAFQNGTITESAANAAIAQNPSGVTQLNSASGQGLFFRIGNGTVGQFSSAGLYTPNALGRSAPVTKSADFTLATTENWLINNKSGSTCTVTLPAASSWTGREVMFQNYQAQTVVSASSNVVPLASGAAGTAILASGAGKWAVLVSDGTNWIITQGN